VVVRAGSATPSRKGPEDRDGEGEGEGGGKGGGGGVHRPGGPHLGIPSTAVPPGQGSLGGAQHWAHVFYGALPLCFPTALLFLMWELWIRQGGRYTCLSCTPSVAAQAHSGAPRMSFRIRFALVLAASHVPLQASARPYGASASGRGGVAGEGEGGREMTEERRREMEEAEGTPTDPGTPAAYLLLHASLLTSSPYILPCHPSLPVSPVSLPAMMQLLWPTSPGLLPTPHCLVTPHCVWRPLPAIISSNDATAVACPPLAGSRV